MSYTLASQKGQCFVAFFFFSFLSFSFLYLRPQSGHFLLPGLSGGRMDVPGISTGGLHHIPIVPSLYGTFAARLNQETRLDARLLPEACHSNLSLLFLSRLL